MQRLLADRAHDPLARLAVDLFVYTVRKSIGALVAALGGVRSLVFTGGMGARSAVVRAEITHGLEFLGVTLDAAKNDEHAPIVSAAGSACTVYVVKTDEEAVIARHVHACLG
jgi:acetate kinase